jgi:outer membrane receptor protein involved in Fe transport
MPASIRRAVADAAPVLACLGLALTAVTLASAGARASADADVWVIAQNDAPEEQDFDPTTGSSSAEPPSDVEVIRIKGRGIQAIATDVPQSVTQFDAAEIEALGAADIASLADVTPNVEIRTAGATSPVFFIRGVGLSDFSANASGAVAIYQDDVPINAPAMQLGLIYDLENVEILRGPQGTGSNRNASAGVFKLISRRPTGELSAGLRAEGGKFGLQDYEGHVEVPIVEEILSARLAFRLRTRNGTMENGCAGAPPFIDRFGVDDPGNLPTSGFPPDRDADPGFLNEDFRGFQFCAPPGAERNRGSTGERLLLGTKNNNPPPQNIRFGGGLQNAWSLIPPDLPKWVNDENRWAARGLFRITPPDLEMDWIVKVHGSRLDQLSTLGQAIGTRGGISGNTIGVFGCVTGAGYQDRDILALLAPGESACAGDVADELAHTLDANAWRGDFNRVGQTTLDIWGGSAIGTWDLGPAVIKSVTAYDQYVRFRDADADQSPDVIFESLVDDSGHQWFQELSLHGELKETPFRWNVGGFYLQEDLAQKNQAITTQGNTDSLRTFTQDLTSWAVYADVSWDFLDDFTLAGGVRWQSQTSALLFAIQFPNNVGTDILADSETWQSPTGDLQLSYRFSDDVSAYWKYTHGWKPGTWNTSAAQGRFVSAARPEIIDAWEWGMAGNWFDGNLFVRASFFYYNYKDKQEFVVDDEPGAPPTLRVINAEGAEIYGVETEVRLQPLVGLLPSDYDGLLLTVRAGWLEATYLEFSTEFSRPVSLIGDVLITTDFTGNRVQNSPQFSVSGTAEWSFDFGRFGALIPRYDFAWRDDTFYDTNEGRGSRNIQGDIFLPEFAIGQVAFTLHNARLSYRSPEGNIEVSGWVRNIGNLQYKQTAFDASAFSSLTINYVGDPRTWGIGIVLNW